ncbi:DnaJ C-terminal domain-containing protein [Acidisphaera sp. L21]|uniref:DnaJ C-terminal domain-containing protein n=1 Tax=Acidisphaera sp. L21 TaxID=1641851 RepID=UPI00131AC0FA|nr:J domain-containing protein [Acidisphaera sp. L21]
MTDPYQTLGVAKDASADDIRRAYRKLAKKHHPDLNPGNKVAEDTFKAVSSANDLLSDPEKRARFDRGEIDAAGDPRPERASYRSYADAAGGRHYGGGQAGMGDIFSDLFSQSFERENRPMRGRDAAYTLSVDFTDAITGTQQRLSLPDGRTLDVRVPAGMESGQTLRLRGQGSEGANSGPAGDALITVTVLPHRFFRRDGNDIHLDLPVTLKEAVLGARVTIPTVTGSVAMTIPGRSDTGKILRLRGRGVPALGSRPAGDQLVTLTVVLPDTDDALESFLREWAPATETNPREGMTEAS